MVSIFLQRYENVLILAYFEAFHIQEKTRNFDRSDNRTALIVNYLQPNNVLTNLKRLSSLSWASYIQNRIIPYKSNVLLNFKFPVTRYRFII